MTPPQFGDRDGRPRRPDKDAQEADFREAVRSLRDRGFGGSLALGSLLASVEGDHRYQQIASEELAPRAGEMDLHLAGEGVLGHSTNAAAFGVFVKRIADSAKVIARDRMGRQRMASDLLVEPGPGSVRVVFRTPDPVMPGSMEDDPASSVWSDPNRQAMALQEIANLLANSDPGNSDASLVDGLVETIPAKARAPLVDAVREIARQEWEIEGEFRQRGLGIQPIRIGPLGARRLESALKVRERQRAELRTTGVIDGLRRARGICWFIQDGSGQEIAAVVPTPELMSQVAELSLDETHRVTAKFTVFTTFGPGEHDSGTKSYVLDEILPSPESPTFDL